MRSALLTLVCCCAVLSLRTLPAWLLLPPGLLRADAVQERDVFVRDTCDVTRRVRPVPAGCHVH
jgi:hypothetical protein